MADEGRSIALFNVAGAFYAIDNTCQHEGGPLPNPLCETVENSASGMRRFVSEFAGGRCRRKFRGGHSGRAWGKTIDLEGVQRYLEHKFGNDRKAVRRAV